MDESLAKIKPQPLFSYGHGNEAPAGASQLSLSRLLGEALMSKQLLRQKTPLSPIFHLMTRAREPLKD